MTAFHSAMALRAVYVDVINRSEKGLYPLDRKSLLLLNMAIDLADQYMAKEKFRLALTTLLEVGEPGLIPMISDDLDLAYSNAWEIQKKMGHAV